MNPVTNKIYVANIEQQQRDGDRRGDERHHHGRGGHEPGSVAVNPVTNKIYVANASSNNVTVIDGATNTTTTVAAGTNPCSVAVNPVTNKIYIANYGSDNVTVLTEQAVSAIPLTTTISPLAGNLSYSATPTFTLSAASTFAPTAPPVQGVFTQVDTWQGSWQAATPSAGSLHRDHVDAGPRHPRALRVRGRRPGRNRLFERRRVDVQPSRRLDRGVRLHGRAARRPTCRSSKTDSADPVDAGSSFDYTLAVSNAGPSTADALTVADTLPAGVTYVSASGTGWTCGELTGTVTCTRAEPRGRRGARDHDQRDSPRPGRDGQQHRLGLLHHGGPGQREQQRGREHGHHGPGRPVGRALRQQRPGGHVAGLRVHAGDRERRAEHGHGRERRAEPAGGRGLRLAPRARAGAAARRRVW